MNDLIHKQAKPFASCKAEELQPGTWVLIEDTNDEALQKYYYGLIIRKTFDEIGEKGECTTDLFIQRYEGFLAPTNDPTVLMYRKFIEGRYSRSSGENTGHVLHRVVGPLRGQPRPYLTGEEDPNDLVASLLLQGGIQGLNAPIQAAKAQDMLASSICKYIKDHARKVKILLKDGKIEEWPEWGVPDHFVPTNLPQYCPPSVAKNLYNLSLHSMGLSKAGISAILTEDIESLKAELVVLSDHIRITEGAVLLEQLLLSHKEPITPTVRIAFTKADGTTHYEPVPDEIVPILKAYFRNFIVDNEEQSTNEQDAAGTAPTEQSEEPKE